MKIPSAITSPMHIGRFSREVRNALISLSRRQPPPPPRRSSAAGRSVLPPFHVVLGSYGSGETLTRYVTVTDGRVIERVPGDGDALAAHLPHNIRYEAGEEDLNAVPPIVAGAPRRFVIEPEQSVYVKVRVAEDGGVEADQEEEGENPATFGVEIVVQSSSETSDHYVPPVGDDEGESGYYLYELASLNSDDPPHLELVKSGSHIDHWRDLPMFENVGDGAGVAKEFNDESRKYELRSLIGKGGISVALSEGGDAIEIDGEGGVGADFNIRLFGLLITNQNPPDILINFDPNYPFGLQWIYVRDGRMIFDRNEVAIPDDDPGDPSEWNAPGEVYRRIAVPIALGDASVQYGGIIEPDE